MTLMPNLSARRMAASICALMPFVANGIKYWEKKGQNPCSEKENPFTNMTKIKVYIVKWAHLKSTTRNNPSLLQPTLQHVRGDEKGLGPNPHEHNNNQRGWPPWQQEESCCEGQWAKGSEYERSMQGRHDVYYVSKKHEVWCSILFTCNNWQKADKIQQLNVAWLMINFIHSIHYMNATYS